MQFKQKAIVAAGYFSVLIAVILSRETGIDWLHYISKPLLMPILMYFFWINTKPMQSMFAKFIMGALALSWLGDIFMMFQGKEIFFILGLGSFLLAHIFYIVSFTRRKDGKGKGFVLSQPLWMFPFLIFGGGLYYWLYPDLGEMKAPVVLYATAITMMAITALDRKGRVNDLSFRYIFIGAVLFVISDSLIALNVFKGGLNYEAFFIMAFYCLAQWLIVLGALHFIKGKSVL